MRYLLPNRLKYSRQFGIRLGDIGLSTMLSAAVWRVLFTDHCCHLATKNNVQYRMAGEKRKLQCLVYKRNETRMTQNTRKRRWNEKKYLIRQTFLQFKLHGPVFHCSRLPMKLHVVLIFIQLRGCSRAEGMFLEMNCIECRHLGACKVLP